MSSTTPFGGRRPWTALIQRPERSARAERFFSAASHCVSKRPIWLGEAAQPEVALPPTIERIAGSCRRRSASFTSSYPARRPNTDCRKSPTSLWRPFRPVRASASISPATVVSPSASSSSRWASKPASEVTTDPRNWSSSRRSKLSLRTSPLDSPVGFAMIEASVLK